MKKYLLSFLICLVALPLMLCGCTTAPLQNAPQTTAQMQKYGSTLVYDNYVYFANAFQSYAEMESGYNADNTAIKRLALDANGKISTDEKTKVPTGQEKVVEKVVASENTFMYSSGKYIYFAAPSREINPASHGEHFYNYNEYFRIGTDGTGLTKFYASSSVISQQTVLKIDSKEYLLIANGTQLVKIELGDKISKPTILAKDFSNVVFAKSYVTEGDQIAYYITGVPEEDQALGNSGNLLFGINIVTGKSLLENEDGTPKAINKTQPRTIALKQVKNGQLFFTIKEKIGATELDEAYAVLTGNFTYTKIQNGLENIGTFEAMLGEDNNEYYLFSNSSGTYAIPKGTLDTATHKIMDQEISLLFTADDYVYFTYKDTEQNAKGMYRISIRDKQVEIINDKADFKTSSISFDGKHIYFYAPNADNTTGANYLHRSKVDIQQANTELLSALLEKDTPKAEEE